MTDPATGRRSRRAVLAAAAGGAAAAASLAIPARTLATSGVFYFGATNYPGVDSTGLEADSDSAALSVSNAGTGGAILAYAMASGAVTVYANSTLGYGVLGDAGAIPSPGLAGTWGRDKGTGGVGAAGSSVSGTGVVGYAAIDAMSTQPPVAGEITGVFGYAPAGTGARARSDTGVALKVSGKASFSRSGRATVAKGRAYVDVDLTAKGGLAGAPLCFANILTRRPGVHVETVQPNYPAAGKVRIFLNKVASTKSSTVLAWTVMS